MNATHEPADQLQPFERPAPRAASASTARGTVDRHADGCGSYGRGIYAGHSTYGLDYYPKDSYARGMEQVQLPEDTQRAPRVFGAVTGARE
jgi:hypothetical protein